MTKKIKNFLIKILSALLWFQSTIFMKGSLNTTHKILQFEFILNGGKIRNER